MIYDFNLYNHEIYFEIHMCCYILCVCVYMCCRWYAIQ